VNVERIEVDLRAGMVTVFEAESKRTLRLDTAEGFDAVSEAWLRAGWDAKYVYGFSWLGRPVIQLPEDLVRIQEVIWSLQPDLVIETGVAHGGTLVFYSSLLELIGRGRVIGVDVEIRPHNREALEQHPLGHRFELVEGDSIAPSTVGDVRARAEGAEVVLVVLDSNHTKAHVLAELEAYAPLVTTGSYIVAMDGIIQGIEGAPRTSPDSTWNNPLGAVDDFLARHPEFEPHEPEWPFNEGRVRSRVTYWPRGFLRRR
jgi:cephalosporin hydroxylase